VVLDPDSARERIYRAVTTVLKAGVTPIIVGGGFPKAAQRAIAYGDGKLQAVVALGARRAALRWERLLRSGLPWINGHGPAEPAPLPRARTMVRSVKISSERAGVSADRDRLHFKVGAEALRSKVVDHELEARFGAGDAVLEVRAPSVENRAEHI